MGEQTFKRGFILASLNERGKQDQEFLCPRWGFKPDQKGQESLGRAVDTGAMPGGRGEGAGSSLLPRTHRDAPRPLQWCEAGWAWCCGHLLRPRRSFLLSVPLALGCDFAAPISLLVSEPASGACVVLCRIWPWPCRSER